MKRMALDSRLKPEVLANYGLSSTSRYIAV